MAVPILVFDNSISLLKKLFTYLNDQDAIKNGEDFEIYDINLLDINKPNQIYMYITTILKEYPDIMIKASISKTEYKNFSDELKVYVLVDDNNNKSFCDLILYDIICSMKLNTITTIHYEDKIDINKDLIQPIFVIETDNIYAGTTIKVFLDKDIVKKSINTINNFITNFTIPMEKKFKLYKILNFLLTKIYDTTTNANTKKILDMFNKITDSKKMACAPRTILFGLKDGGYNNKSGDIDYHICKANFKQTFKKVSAKSSREGAKMVAMKVLKDKKKSVKFTLKRMIGKKEKCYDYDVSIDKSGKITIKNQ